MGIPIEVWIGFELVVQYELKLLVARVEAKILIYLKEVLLEMVEDEEMCLHNTFLQLLEHIHGLKLLELLQRHAIDPSNFECTCKIYLSIMLTFISVDLIMACFDNRNCNFTTTG